MTFHRFYAAILLAVAVSFLSVPSAQAYTAADYYNAGLQLYNAQNYTQAIQYFSAALQVDPNNTAALQGRANCYYAQGQYQQALDDYQKVQAISPNPQLASMIQSLQAKVGTSAAAAPPPAPGATTEDSFAQGTALFQQRQYAQALPYFQKATQENPKNANAYYYLGACQMQTGDLKDAAVALGVSNKLNPNPSVENYVNQLKSRLSPDDHQWVDGQITAQATASAAGVSSPSAPKNFGVRLEPAIVLISLPDLTAAVQTSQQAAQQAQASDPSLTFSGSVPTGYVGVAVEPVMKIGKNLELGLPLAFHPVGSVKLNTSDSNGNVNISTYDISAFSVGLTGRYLIDIGKGDFQPFIAGGPLFCPISTTLSGSTGSAGSTVTGSGNFSGTAVGGQIQVGLDWHLGDTFTVTPFGGFQLASANSFTGSLTVSGGGISQSASGQLEYSTSSKIVYFLQNGQTPGNGDRPMQIDLSGPLAGIQISAFF